MVSYKTLSDSLIQILFYSADTLSWQAAKLLPNKYRLRFYACFEVALINQALHALPSDICPRPSQE